jgi:hypothetical protein
VAGRSTSAIDRPLGSTENIYWLLDRLYCLNFIVFAELESGMSHDKLRSALAAVQEENPLLRARIVMEGGRNWFKPVATKEAPLLPEMRSLRNWRAVLERELQRHFATDDAPLARFISFEGSGGKSVAAMVFHHAIGDGRSGASVFFDVLRRATHDASPPKPKRANASSQHLDPIAHELPVVSAFQKARFWLGKGKDALQGVEQLPGYDMRPHLKTKIRILPLAMAEGGAEKLLANARGHGTTMHGALAAAQLLAINDQFEGKAPRTLALNSLADLRGVQKGELTERDLGLYITTLSTVHALPAEPDFWLLAREVRDRLKAIVDGGNANLINGVYSANPLFATDDAAARLVQRIVALAPASSMLTNIGKLEEPDLGGQLRIASLGFAVSPPAQHPISVTASSYAGRLQMNLLYDEAKLPKQQAQEIADGMMARLAGAAEGNPAPRRGSPARGAATRPR